MLLLLIGLLSNAQGTNIDDDGQIQSNEYKESIQLHIFLLSHHHGMVLEALPLVGILDIPSAKMCGR